MYDFVVHSNESVGGKMDVLGWNKSLVETNKRFSKQIRRNLQTEIKLSRREFWRGVIFGCSFQKLDSEWMNSW